MADQKQRKIKFFYAGGTIGMKPLADGTLAPPDSDDDFRETCLPVVKSWQAENGILVDYEFITSKDSMNMTPDDWQSILYLAHEAQEAGYNAVCIAHGTDTLVYTAAALAFGFHDRDPEMSALTIPIVLTGAQNPIYQFGGDGGFNLQNLFRTAKAAMELEVADVLINFGYDVLKGCRALKVSERAFNAFEAPSEIGRVGFIDAFGVHLFPHRLTKSDKTRKGTIQPRFSRGVVVIDLAPGIEPGLLENMIKGGGVMAMIIKSLGEGNVCTEGAYNMIPFIETAVKKYRTPILIASKYFGGAVGRAHYESGKAPLEAGALPCFDTTDCAVEVKVRWLLGNGIASGIEELRQAMSISYVGEVTVGAGGVVR
jgi:L-asparaginase/Glu-tRNA(Gln) amidotransferase subunit D